MEDKEKVEEEMVNDAISKIFDVSQIKFLYESRVGKFT